MRIAIIGYGRMGQMIEKHATARGHEITLKLDHHNNANQSGITPASFANVDVAIDFSLPDQALANIQAVAATGKPLVVGTTGWLESLAEVKGIVERSGIGFVWSPNFSIGVQAFFRIVSEAAKLMSQQPEYEAWAYEIHHSKKLDAPSGTLLKLIDAMKESGYSSKIDVSSNRAGNIPGTHEIGFDSLADTITLKHQARSRDGFALGAVHAAEWVVGKSGFYEFGETLWK
ncbi:MAG: 4-hydroxy-tetrahydrodipicolinate reductase [Fimbriimonadaceae bacterium]|nr:4-hydroxy-tetrahydrodipicolinate reductase [Fimbriimonadaceae bacterium]